MRLKLATAVLAIAALPAVASAHWQFSQWGMSPAQVIAASKGKAVAKPLDYGDSIGADQHLASADVTVEGEAAKAGFYFTDGKTLSRVRLVLKTAAGCDRVEAALVKRHGPKSPSGKYFWIDKAAGDIVEYADDRSWQGSTCRVTYSAYVPK